jgi:hypothetical protein
MPTVGDLNGTGCAAPGAIGVRGAAISADDLDLRPLAQPPRKAIGLTIREQIDHPAALEVAQDRPVALATPPCPIIDTKDARGHRRAIRAGTDHPKQRIATQRHRQPGRQARTGSTAQRQPDMTLNVAQAEGPAGADTNDAREPLRENPSWASVRRASEPTRENRDDDHQPLPGKVGKRASVSAVDMTR